MELDITKLDRQQIGAQKWRNNNGVGTLNWPPRFGKTFGTIEFIVNPHLKAKDTNFIFILVPSEIILEHWKNNLLSYAIDLNRIKLFTASFLSANLDEIECSLLIVDEIQKFTTPERKSMLDGTIIKSKYQLALTGTYPTEVEWIKELYPIVDELSEDEAIANKWIAPFVEYNILLELPQKDKARYEKFTKPITETLELFKGKSKLLTREHGQPIFDSDYQLITACYTGFSAIPLQGGKAIWITYDRLCNTLASLLGWHVMLDVSIPVNEELHNTWSPMAIHSRAKQFMDYVRSRNEILIDNTVKLHTIGEIVAMNTVSTICFNESTKFADSVSDYINMRFNGVCHAACYHSKMDSRAMIDPETGEPFKFTTGDRKGLPKILGKTAIKKIVIEGVRSGYYNFLSTARALDEGVDIPVIEQVICTGGTTNPLTYQQRTARGKTVDIYNPDKITKIFNLVFDDFNNSDGELIKSRDKTKLILRQKQTGATVRWIKNLADININE